MTSQFGLSQIIKEAAHILESSSLCIDLIFTTQLNLVVESGVHPSLHPNCHHQLYSQNLIYKYITHHHTHEKSGTINKQILNLSDGQLLTLIDFVPHETTVCDDKDLPWFNKAIKSLIQEKKDIQKIWQKQK